MTTKHPEMSVEILGYSFTERVTLLDVRVHTHDIATWVEELQTIKDVHHVEPLGRAKETTALRVTCKSHNILTTFGSLHLTLRTPFTIVNGVTEVVMAGQEPHVRHLMQMFPKLQFHVRAIHSNEEKERALLTRRQSEMIRRAVEAGYFEVPRRISLTALAARIGITTSSMSEVLAVAERKIINRFQAENG
jgi:predicted DNA binding protein